MTTAITYEIKELVEALDPTRDDETVEYDFRSGKKYKRHAGEWYADAGE